MSITVGMSITFAMSRPCEAGYATLPRIGSFRASNIALHQSKLSWTRCMFFSTQSTEAWRVPWSGSHGTTVSELVDVLQPAEM